MSEIDQTRRLVTKFFRANIARSPIVDHRRIKCRLIEFMFDKQPPVRWDRGVDLAHRVEITLQSPAKIGLSRKIAPIANPHGQRFRADLLADLYAFDIVLDRLSSCGGVFV